MQWFMCFTLAILILVNNFSVTSLRDRFDEHLSIDHDLSDTRDMLMGLEDRHEHKKTIVTSAIGLTLMIISIIMMLHTC
ncbi:MAG TPA: hypothetical protein ENI23_02115 [bacterium]|nr:hypothetical protein [bacterium]